MNRRSLFGFFAGALAAPFVPKAALAKVAEPVVITTKFRTYGMGYVIHKDLIERETRIAVAFRDRMEHEMAERLFKDMR